MVKDRCHAHALEGILELDVERSCDVCREKFEFMWRFACAACDFNAHMSCLTASMPLPSHLTDARHAHELVLSSQSRSGTPYVCHVCHRPGRTWVYECQQCSPLVSIHPDCIRINTTQHSQAGHWLRLDFVSDDLASCDVAHCRGASQSGDTAALSCAVASWSDEPDCPYLAHFACAKQSLAPFDRRSQVGIAMEQGMARKIQNLKNEISTGAPQKPRPASQGQLPLETHMSHLKPFSYPSTEPPSPFSPHPSHLPPAGYPSSQPPPPGYPSSQPGYPTSQPGYFSSQPGYPSGQPGYPSSQPAYPSSQPGYPSSQPAYPSSQPGYPSSQPGYPSFQPAYPSILPAYPSSQPGYPSSQPGYPSSQTGYPSSQPGYPSSQPGYPSSQPGDPSSQPVTPSTQPGYPSSPPSYPSSRPPPEGYPSSPPQEPSRPRPGTPQVSNIEDTQDGIYFPKDEDDESSSNPGMTMASS